jgi:hypothetical protein
MGRETHRVAIVVFCEAEGVDEDDATTAALMALRTLIEDGRQDDKQGKVGSVRGPTCDVCGVSWLSDEKEAGLDSDGNVSRHVEGERVAPEEIDDDEIPAACEGSGKPPRTPDEAVIGFDRQTRGGIYARVHQVIGVGMATGNGYLQMRPTWKAFR